MIRISKEYYCCYDHCTATTAITIYQHDSLHLTISIYNFFKFHVELITISEPNVHYDPVFERIFTRLQDILPKLKAVFENNPNFLTDLLTFFEMIMEIGRTYITRFSAIQNVSGRSSAFNVKDTSVLAKTTLGG